MKRSVSALFICILTLATGNSSFCQDTTSAGIVGQGLATSRAGVPGALVTVLNVGTNARRTAQTDSDGMFSVPNLAPARYEVRIEKQGFQTGIIEALDLRIGDVSRRTVELRVGAVSESVVIEAQAPLLATENGTINQGIDT